MAMNILQRVNHLDELYTAKTALLKRLETIQESIAYAREDLSLEQFEDFTQGLAEQMATDKKAVRLLAATILYYRKGIDSAYDFELDSGCLSGLDVDWLREQQETDPL